MFLSQLLVNAGSHPDKPRPGLDWVKQTYRVHQRIWMAFPDEHRLKEDPFFLGAWSSDSLSKPQRTDGGFLFRIEPEPPLRVLVQSKARPNWEYAFQNAQYLLASPPQVREFEPAIEAGKTYRFRLVMQMVRRRTARAGEVQEGRKARSEHPIRCLLAPDENGQRRPDPDFTAWRERLVTVAGKSGFTTEAGPGRLHVRPATNLVGKPSGQPTPHRFNAAMFEGVLTCTDAELLRQTVINGLGRGKAFGMGLLSLAMLR